MQNNNQQVVFVNDSDDDEVKMWDENDRLIKDLTKREVIAMFDGFQVPPPYWDDDDRVFPLFLVEAIRDQDAFCNDTVIRDSHIPNAGNGLFTTVAVPKGHQYPYSGVLKLMYAGHVSDEDVFYGSMEHRSVEPMCQPFLHLGIRIFVVGSLNSAATYMNDLDYKLKEPPTRTANNCMIVGTPHDDYNTMTVGSFKAWLRNMPVTIETIEAIATETELLTSYFYRTSVEDIDEVSSSENDTSDSDWHP